MSNSSAQFVTVQESSSVITELVEHAHLFSSSWLAPPYSRVILSALLGITAHQLFFRKGEWHMQAPALTLLYLAASPIVLVGETIFGSGICLKSFSNASSIILSFTIAILGSIASYRLFFHRMRHFPGPRLAATTKFWHTYQCLGSKNHLVLEQLRNQYGDFVRTGPNEITIFHPEALYKLDGPGNKCTKSMWYDFLLPDMGVNTIRDKAFHDQRRRVWNKGFTTKHLASYEDQISEHVNQLESLIVGAISRQREVNFSTFAYWFSFDVMGMFALSYHFNMMRNEEWHYSIATLRRAMAILGPLSSVPWVGQIGFKFLKGYWVVRDWHTMTAFCRDRMTERIARPDAANDVAQTLIDDARAHGSLDASRHLLAGDAVVAIIAGSDTVAPTMVFLFYELALHPEHAETLFAELQGVDIRDPKALARLPHLNAVIRETLRLHPAVPSGGYRDTPKGGMMIGGRYVPGEVTVVAPRWSIHRRESGFSSGKLKKKSAYARDLVESCFPQGNKWIPERWTTRPELVRDARSFLPFSQGRYTCLGKDVAMSELRLVTARLMAKYTVRFAEGMDPKKVEGDMTDQFTATPGELQLVFDKRDDAEAEP